MGDTNTAFSCRMRASSLGYKRLSQEFSTAVSTRLASLFIRLALDCQDRRSATFVRL